MSEAGVSIGDLIVGIPMICQAGFPTVSQLSPMWENPRMVFATISEKERLKALLRERVRERLDAAEKTPHQVSRAIGANPGYIRDLLDPERTNIPSAERAQLLAIELNTTSDYLLGRAASPAPVMSEVSVLDRVAPWQGPERSDSGIPLVGTGDCADLTVTGEHGETIEIERISFDPDYTVRYIDRPRALFGDASVYAIQFNGSSMEPRFFAGEIGIAMPMRHPAPGDFVVVQLNDGESGDVTSVLVKRLVSRNSREVVLEQYEPRLTFSVPRARVARIHPLYRAETYL